MQYANKTLVRKKKYQTKQCETKKITKRTVSSFCVDHPPLGTAHALLLRVVYILSEIPMEITNFSITIGC